MKSKLDMAHEYALEMAKQGIPLKSCLELGWKYADAMYRVFESKEDKTRSNVLLDYDEYKEN